MSKSFVKLPDAISYVTSNLPPYGKVISIKHTSDETFDVKIECDLLNQNEPSDIVVSGGSPEDSYEWQYDGYGTYMRPFHKDELPVVEVSTDDPKGHWPQ